MTHAALAHPLEPALSPGLLAACLTPLAQALSRPRDGAGETDEAVTKSLVLALNPRNAMQLILASQVVLFNTLAADAARDILGGMDENLKPRAVSNLIAMGRLAATHLKMLTDLQSPAAGPEQEKIPTNAGPPEPQTPEIAIAEHRPAVEAPATSEPASTRHPYPGRAKMLAAHGSRTSDRRRKLVEHKLMNVLRAAAAMQT